MATKKKTAKSPIWEYTLVQMVGSQKDWKISLDMIGTAGWELAGIVPNNLFIFKRLA